MERFRWNARWTWPLFVIACAAIAYLTQVVWTQRIIAFVIMAGGIALWTRWWAKRH